MGEVLGIGCPHGPHLRFTDESMANEYFRFNLRSEKVPDHLKDPANWPAQMREEYGDDDGVAAARRHRAEALKGYRAARKAIDDFNPDFVVMFGDDQYENFREDVLPPFCVYAMDEITLVGRREGGRPRPPELGVRMETPPLQQTVRGSKEIGTFLATGLIENGFDVACAWQMHHLNGLGHAFGGTIDYLDWDRAGFPYPLIPFHVNCYGADLRIPTPEAEDATGQIMEGVRIRPPAAPPPWRCYDLGRALAKEIEASPYRAVIIGSSSWSHASLTKAHGYLWGDVDSDREHFEQLKASRFSEWRDLDAEQLRQSGQHEMRNWICLAGAMEGRQAEILAYAETYIFNSCKCIALFPTAAPVTAGGR